MILKDKTVFYYIGILIAFIIVSCDKEPDSVGGELFQKEELSIGLDTTDFVRAYSYKLDSIYTKNKAIYQFGSIYDAVFGQMSSSVYFQIASPKALPKPYTGTVDSVVLELNIQGIYGDITTTQSLHVFQLADTIHQGKSYFSTNKIPLNMEKGVLGSVSYTNKSLIDQIQENEVAKLRVRLDNALIGSFILNMDSIILSSNSKFDSLFKGLAIIPEPLQSADRGSTMTINFAGTAPKLMIYYNDTLTTCRFISGTTNAFSYYEHNILASQDPVFKQQMNGDTTQGESNIYLEGLGGSRALIKFPGLKDWVNNRKLFIHQAKLILPVELSANQSFFPPEKLTLLMRTDSTVVSLPDERRGSLIGGQYSQNFQRYDYTITMYIQDLVNGVPDKGLQLSIKGGTSSPERIKLKGTNPGLEENIRLKIIYTELK